VGSEWEYLNDVEDFSHRRESLSPHVMSNQNSEKYSFSSCFDVANLQMLGGRSSDRGSVPAGDWSCDSSGSGRVQSNSKDVV